MERTNTTHLTTFEHPFPAAATFIFSEPNTIRVAIPEGSTFHVPWHWHYTTLDTTRISWVSGGRVIISHGSRDSWRTVSHSGGYEGFSHLLFVDQAMSWGPLIGPGKKPQLPLVVDMEVTDATLQRNICSAILDRELFFQLASTPWWAKALSAVSTKRIREWALGVVLKIQLQAIYYAHDYHLYYGEIPFDIFSGFPWWSDDSYSTDRAYRSRFWASRIVMRCYYWIGRIFLGMKGEYEEYTPSRNVVGNS